MLMDLLILAVSNKIFYLMSLCPQKKKFFAPYCPEVKKFI